MIQYLSLFLGKDTSLNWVKNKISETRKFFQLFFINLWKERKKERTKERKKERKKERSEQQENTGIKVEKQRKREKQKEEAHTKRWSIARRWTLDIEVDNQSDKKQGEILCYPPPPPPQRAIFLSCTWNWVPMIVNILGGVFEKTPKNTKF